MAAVLACGPESVISHRTAASTGGSKHGGTHRDLGARGG